MATVNLTKGKVALIDDEDLLVVAKYNWHTSNPGYARTSLKGGKKLYLHHLLMGDVMVDHINGDKLDNRRQNLRIATKGQNSSNRKSYSKAGFKGVLANGSGWMAQITINKKRIYLGQFKSPEEAARAYDKAALEAFGEFASLNFS